MSGCTIIMRHVLGLGMPYVKEVLETKVRPENAGTDIAHLGYGTFLYCSEGFE